MDSSGALGLKRSRHHYGPIWKGAAEVIRGQRHDVVQLSIFKWQLSETSCHGDRVLEG